MIDHWLGKLLDAIDAKGLADDTHGGDSVTDHGHYLGEKDIWGKPPAPDLPADRAYPADDRRARRGRPASAMR